VPCQVKIFLTIGSALGKWLMWNDFLPVSIAAGYLLLFLGVLYAVRVARRALALPGAATRSYESRLESLQSSHAEMRDQLDFLADQIKMMNVRSKITHATRKTKATDEPDPIKDPDSWRQWMTRKLNRQKAGLME